MTKYYTVTVMNVSQLVVEASSEEEARKLTDARLAAGDANTMAEVKDCAAGWEVSDCELFEDWNAAADED